MSSTVNIQQKQHTETKNIRKQALETAMHSLEMREMTPRVERLYSRLQERMTKKQKVWGGTRSVLNERTSHLPTTNRRALAFEHVLLNMPIGIETDDLIVGNCVEKGVAVRCLLPQFVKDEELGKTAVSMSHKTPDYELLVHKGLQHVLLKIDQKKAELENQAHQAQIRKKLDLLEAMMVEAKAAIKMARRYADLAEDLSITEKDSARKEELIRIAEVCRRVPEYPARTMQEAIQSFWFINYAFFQTETNISCGRLDQLFNPFFTSDVEKGILTTEQGQELIDCLCLRINDRIQIDPDNYAYSGGQESDVLGPLPKQFNISHNIGYVRREAPLSERGEPQKGKDGLNDQTDAINHWGQNVLISGLKADKTDGTSAVTYMFLNANEKLSLTSPVLTVRLHKKSPQALLVRTAEVLKHGGGMPFINNDDVIIDAYAKQGVKWEDACDYANSNCWETLIQGKSNQEMIRGINFLLYLELVLNRGRSLLTGEVLGLDTGDPLAFESFDDLMAAWKKQIEYSLKTRITSAANQILGPGGHGPYSTMPLLSALMSDCIENAEDLTHCGARYTIWHVLGEAASNAADAMAAIRKLVFEEQKMSMEQLLTALRSNWEGQEDRTLRQMIVNDAPKFGNDIDFVDDLCKEMCDYFLVRTQVHTAPYKDKIIFPCSIATFSWIISIGKRIAASADGRMHSEPIASNLTPVPGSDTSGPTAAINSYLKINTKAMAAGVPIDLRMNRNSIEGEQGNSRLANIIKTFIDMDGNMITLTVTSAEELKKAMREPEKYRNLRVRMGGWSGYFVLLSREHQSIHLKRVEHGLA